jgi:hypothetical protein
MNTMDYCREKLKWEVEKQELIEQVQFAHALVKATKSMAETCKEERAMGNGGCGACSICCSELRRQLEQFEFYEKSHLQREKWGDILAPSKVWNALWDAEAKCDRLEHLIESQRGNFC